MARSPEPLQYYAVVCTSYPSSVVASCSVAALFLLLAVGGAAAALFLLIQPHTPAIAMTAVQLLSFAFGNGIVAFTFQQLASICNPNCAPLMHYDSSIHVTCADRKVSFMYIPVDQIDGEQTQYMATSLTVLAFAISSSTR